jgi:outer membrane protein assembly factor BamA
MIKTQAIFDFRFSIFDSGNRKSKIKNQSSLCVLCLVSYILCLAPYVLCLASEDYPSLKWLGLPVVSVEYTCDGEFSEAEVRSATFVQAGGVYSRSDIRKSIEKIYSLGGFSKVEVSARPADNGVILTFGLTKQIKTGSVYLTGNKELGEEGIIQVMRLKNGREYDDSIAEIDVQSIKELYRSRGYSDADVSFKPIIDDNSKQADIYFEIIENKQPFVGEIVLIGTNQAVIRTKMLFHIGLEFQNDLDSKNISAGLLQEFQSKGNSLSDKAAVSIERAGSRWLVTDVQKAYSIRKEEDRLNVYKTRTLLEVMREVRLGEPYKGKQALDSDKKLIEQIHRQRDYITAKIKKAQALSDPDIIKEYHEKGTHFLIHLPPAARHPSPVSIIIEIEQGRRVYIKIEGDKDIKDDIIKRSIAVQRMHSVSEPVLRKSDEDIENLHKLKGYYLAKVEHEVLEDKVWIFGTDGDTEEQRSGGMRERGWRPFGELTSMDVSGNSLRVSSSDSIPQIQSPKVEIDTDIYQKIHIRMRINKGSVGRLYWTDKPDKWDREKHQDFDLASDNQFRNYEIDLRNHKKWHGKVIQLRLRPVDLPGADIDIASIKVTTEFIPIVFRVDKKRLMRVKEVSIMAPSLFSIDSKFQTYLDRSSRGMGDFPHENISAELRREFESKGTSLSQDATVSIEKKGSEWLIENSRDIYIVRKEEGKLEIHPKLELDEENIRKQMLTRKRNPLSFWPLSSYLPDGIFYEPIFEMDRRAIIAFYKDKGYPNAEVVDYKIDPKEENGEIDLLITIDEGSKVLVTDVILEGNYKDILDNEEILKNLAVVPSFQEQNLTIESSDPPRVRYKISPPKVFR